jgi:hypothetical protein
MARRTMRPRAPLAARGGARCKECGDAIKRATPGLHADEIAARRLGFCSLSCKETDDND